MAEERPTAPAGETSSDRAPAPTQMRLLMELTSFKELARYLFEHHKAEVCAVFPDGNGDVAAFALRKLKQLEGRA